MSQAASRGMLRLVGARVDATPPTLTGGNARTLREASSAAVLSEADRARRSVAAENVRAAGVDETDARWLLAQHTAGMLESGRGRLRPERRRQLHEVATRLGLRAFDTNLVIAVVQDAAVHEEDALSVGCRERLTMVGGAGALHTAPSKSPVSSLDMNKSSDRDGFSMEAWLQLGTSLALGLMGAMMLASWIAMP